MFSFCFGPEWYTLLHVSLLATEEKCFSSSHFHILFTPLCGDVRMLEKIITERGEIKQREENNYTAKPDELDSDGMGDFTRFPDK